MGTELEHYNARRITVLHGRSQIKCKGKFIKNSELETENTWLRKENRRAKASAEKLKNDLQDALGVNKYPKRICDRMYYMIQLRHAPDSDLEDATSNHD